MAANIPTRPPPPDKPPGKPDRPPGKPPPKPGAPGALSNKQLAAIAKALNDNDQDLRMVALAIPPQERGAAMSNQRSLKQVSRLQEILQNTPAKFHTGYLHDGFQRYLNNPD